MRVSRIEFKGYKRLADTATSIDGGLTAFVGFNEAGKTSLLHALEWFSRGGALGVTDLNRSRPPVDDQPVVRVFFELSADDKRAVADIPSDKKPTSLIVTRKTDGKGTYTMTPHPRRPAAPFEAASERLSSARSALAKQFDEAADDTESDPNDWADTVIAHLERPQSTWPDEAQDHLRQLRDWSGEIPTGKKRARDGVLARLLGEILTLVERDLPSGEMYSILGSLEPDFVLFRDENRSLETSYELEPSQRQIPRAVSDLLTIAQVDAGALWTHIEQADSTQRETLLERGNERLHALFSRVWNQSGVTVRLNTSGSRLEIMVRELRDGGDVTNISERSDGLRTFVALVAFLAAGEHDVPPVLLIDEAETHLHYDAQADLVGVLLKSVNAEQVIYTTHSPGCLPSDLGTGIRVLARDPEHGDASLIKNNFWQSEGPGFSPLLFAMGAGAAAFSVCRRAVLAEGAADMILLPSLIRTASGEADLDYQVAQGLASAHTSDLKVEEIAAKVVYLVDGDPGGEKHADRLVEAGVKKNRVFSLPPSAAAEDLIPKDDYLRVVNDFLTTMGQTARFTTADVVDDQPISTSFSQWAKKKRVQIPSKVEVAYAILRLDNLRLTRDGKSALKSLHSRFQAAFDTTPPE